MFILRWILWEFPDSEKIATNIEQEQALAALAKTKGSRK